MDSFPVLQEQEGDWTSSKTVRVAGVRIHQFFTAKPTKLCDAIVNFRTRNDDVFIASFPKSGTTWMQEIVWQLYHNGEISTRKLGARVPMVERLTDAQGVDVRNTCSPRLMNTHLPYDVIPKGESEDAKCKYIYIARNPKDVAVSYYKFEADLSPITGYNGPWDFFVKLFLDGKVPYESWVDHVLGWWKHKDDFNVLFLKYEDLKKDLASNVRAIAQFLEKPATEELINRIAEQCTFKSMLKNESAFQVTGEAHGTKLLRKGEIGDWKNYFTPELNERFEKEVLEKLKGTGLEFEFGI